MKTKLSIALTCTVLAASSATYADSIGEPGRSSDGPNPLNNVYFGEQHLHTQGWQGSCRNS
jgi:hypothetical protein